MTNTTIQKIKSNLKLQFSNGNKYELMYGAIALTVLFTISLITISSETPVGLTTISIIAGFSGVMGTLLAAKKSIGNYLGGIIHIVLYGMVSLFSGVYGDFMLNILYFLPLNIYAIFVGQKISDDKGIVKSKKLEKNKAIFTFIITITLGISFAFVLQTIGDIAPGLDSFSTVFSVVGMILMMKAYKEQYYIGSLVNVVSVIMGVVSLSLGNAAAIPMIIMGSIYVINGFGGLYNGNKKPKYVGNVQIKGTSTGTKAIYK